MSGLTVYYASLMEYVTLRLFRRFLPRILIERLYNVIPGFKRSVGTSEPARIAAVYSACCKAVNLSLSDKTVLEIGSGSTNGTGYELVKRGARQWTGYEPYALFDAKQDSIQKQFILPSLAYDKKTTLVRRVTSISEFGSNKADIILSHSVLEHVDNFSAFFNLCSDVLTTNGVMIHCVDYRDHFFKYPFHFLLFSDRIWNRYLSPGNLTRHRLPEHIQAMNESGFTVSVYNRESDPASFNRIKEHLHNDFKIFTDSDLMATYAEIVGVKSNE